MKTYVLLDVEPCRLLDTDRRFKAHYASTISTPETPVSIYQTTQRNIPEGNHLQEDIFYFIFFEDCSIHPLIDLILEQLLPIIS
jgi:hypothetical protein